MGGVSVLAFFGGFLGLINIIFWMVAGWRAMVAHEKLAAAAQELAAKKVDLQRIAQQVDELHDWQNDREGAT